MNRFLIGLCVCAVGGVCIVTGDRHDNLASKALVCVGVAMTVLGIGVLRYMLFQSLKDRRARFAIGNKPRKSAVR